MSLRFENYRAARQFALWIKVLLVLLATPAFVLAQTHAHTDRKSSDLSDSRLAFERFKKGVGSW